MSRNPGSMKPSPAKIPPIGPRASVPKYTQSSCASGPGSTWYRASTRLKWSRETQPSSSTNSWRSIAICATGPPQANAPNLRNRRNRALSASGPVTEWWRSVGVGRQAVVLVRGHAVMRFSCRSRWVHMDQRGGQVWDVVQELMVHREGHGVRLGHGEGWIDGDVELGVQAMPKPARAHFGDGVHFRHVVRCVRQLVEHLRVHTVQHPGEDAPGGVPDDPEDGQGDPETDEWIGQGVAEPHTHSA